MQRRSSNGPSHVALGESEAAGDAAQNGQAVAPSVDPFGRPVDADPLVIDPAAEDAASAERLKAIGCGPVELKHDDQAGPTIAERLRSLDVELLATADMPRSLLVGKIKAAATRAGLVVADEDDFEAEADRIWRSFDENRTGPREVLVNGDGTVAGMRPAEMTPDRGSDVGTTVHTVTGDEPRFSGVGAGETAQQMGLFLVPKDSEFNGRAYREAPELANLAEKLIEQHGFLDQLQNCDVRWYWKRKTGVSKGRVKIGFMKRASDLLGHFSGADFIGWLSATTCRDGKFTDEQVTAAVFHQLLHIDSDDKGNWIFVPHDFEGFAQEVRHFGTWTEGLKLGGSAFVAAQQMGLFDASQADDEDEDLDEDDDDVEAYDPEEDGEESEAGEPIRAWERYRTTSNAEAEPDTSGELPTGEEIDAERAERAGSEDVASDEDLADLPFA